MSRIALFYFYFSLVYCISQLAFQGWAFKINNEAGLRLSEIIDVSGIKADIAALTAKSQVASANTPAPLQDNVIPTDPLSTSTLTLVSTSTTSSRASPPTASPRPRPRSSSSVRTTRTATSHDPDETERDDSRNKIRQFTKRDDGIIRINGGNVSGGFVPNLEFYGEPGVILNDVCVRDLIWPQRT